MEGIGRHRPTPGRSSASSAPGSGRWLSSRVQRSSLTLGESATFIYHSYRHTSTTESPSTAAPRRRALTITGGGHGTTQALPAGSSDGRGQGAAFGDLD